jgi:SAM-dependent methyltransferase
MPHQQVERAEALAGQVETRHAVRVDELVAPPELRRNRCRDSDAALDAAQAIVMHMCEDLGLDDLGALDVLDVGCGIRFTQVFLSREMPIGRYVGIDVEPKIIDFLRTNVDDPRFEYYLLNAHNKLYNPNGVALADLTIPELEGRRFDLVCLLSVFTHLAPHDYVAMLRLLRRHVTPNGTLFYTLFVNEQSDGGHGYVDGVARRVAERASTKPPPPPGLAEALRRHRQIPDFIDAEPATPLMVALYSRSHALELVTGTGWEVRSLRPPDVHLQHHMICAPVA